MTKKVKISASILGANLAKLAEAVQMAEKAGCDEIHFDIMDGKFVPNISLGFQFIPALRHYTSLPFDVHMMVQTPRRFFDFINAYTPETLTLHIETCEDIGEIILEVGRMGIKIGLALDVETDAEVIFPYLNDIDRVLVMTVKPGFAGQKFMKTPLIKVGAILEQIKNIKTELEIGLDGGINSTTMSAAHRTGADVFISGTGIYKHPKGVKFAVEELRRLC